MGLRSVQASCRYVKELPQGSRKHLKRDESRR